MREFVITTDSTVDLPFSYLQEEHITIIPLTYTIEGETYRDLTGLSSEEFYKKVRNGAVPITSQFNPKQAIEVFSDILATGRDILHIAFSSALSGSYNSARIAAEELMEEREGCKILVLDSLCASMGEGLLLYLANQWRKQGKTLEEVAVLVEKRKRNICHMFTVEDLQHLHRGGRIGKTTAILGSVMKIKPVLHMDEGGRLVAVGKVRGRKKALHNLVDRMEEQMGGFQKENQNMVMISHGDCEEDAQYVRELLQERFGFTNVMINTIGAVIGSHAGPGAVALFFLGEKR